MKHYTVKLYHDSGITEERVAASSARQAVSKFVSGIGSLCMINYIRCLRSQGARSEWEVMGTSGLVLTLATEVSR